MPFGESNCEDGKRIANAAHRRSNNSPAKKSSRQTMSVGIRTGHIQSGKHQQNAFVDRFNSMDRDDWLSQFLCCDLDEIRERVARPMWRYSHGRPNMALFGITPKQ